LLKALCDSGFEVSLETSGAMDIKDVDGRVSVVLDLKTPGSGESSKNLLSNLDLIKAKDQIKVVVTSEDDFRWFELFCDEHQSVFNAGVVWVSPSYGEIDLKQLATLILSSKHPFRMQLQLHKQIWGEESGR
jgi:7-carboxy-7-deazaguanine synthase